MRGYVHPNTHYGVQISLDPKAETWAIPHRRWCEGKWQVGADTLPPPRIGEVWEVHIIRTSRRDIAVPRRRLAAARQCTHCGRRVAVAGLEQCIRCEMREKCAQCGRVVDALTLTPTTRLCISCEPIEQRYFNAVRRAWPREYADAGIEPVSILGSEEYTSPDDFNRSGFADVSITYVRASDGSVWRYYADDERAHWARIS